MPPRSDEVTSSLGFKLGKNRNHPLDKGQIWLEDKRHDDGAEGLWRIHDGLYDLTTFINDHPGGKSWLQMTKGTDVTEAFEAHHLSDKPSQLRTKFLVRPAKTARNSPFTFKENGFYRTLKRQVIPIIKKAPKAYYPVSDQISDGLLLSTYLTGILAAYFDSYFIALIAGFLMCSTLVAGHNYFHRRDNFRMYYYNISFLDFKDWRIIHSLSHHLVTNTIQDLEISTLEPFIAYLPTEKPLMKKILSCIYAPIFWVIFFHLHYIKRFIYMFKYKPQDLQDVALLIPYILPTVMYMFGGNTLLKTLVLWNVIILMTSTQFSGIAFNAGHHHPDVFHDGDSPRPKNQLDWGIAQLDTLIERNEVSHAPLFVVLTTFGDHALHHLFPTLDHRQLDMLYPIFGKICKQFKLNLKYGSAVDMVKGQFEQLVRTEVNKKAPI